MSITFKDGCEQEYCFCFLKKSLHKCEGNVFGFKVNMGNLMIQCKVFVN